MLVVLAVMVLVVLLKFHSRMVEWATLIGKNRLTGLLVAKIFMDSEFMETGGLVRQRMLIAVSVGQVLPNGIFVVLAVLVFQSILEVLLVRQVSLSPVVVANALGHPVVRTIRVCKSLVQVPRFAEILLDSVAMGLTLLVEERMLVECGIRFEFLLVLCEKNLVIGVHVMVLSL